MAKQPTGTTANELDRKAFKSFGERNSAILTQTNDRPTHLPSVFF